MKIKFNTLLIAVGLISILFSCLDHRLGGPLSPAQLRLKTVQSGTAVTTYTYDSQNRLSRIDKSDGSLGLLSYDDANKKYIYFSQYANASDQTTGSITLYPYDLNGTSFRSQQYPITQSTPFYALTYATYSYGFDINKHLTEYYKSDGADNATARNGASYTYIGENILTSASVSGRNISPPTSYQYDDKINPLFGLLDPSVDPVQRFSRNNVIRADYPGNLTISATYGYDYNQQNLPTKRTDKQTGAVLTTYTYEPY